jgi:two-component system nitrate/nitrite sensor histidine kinase NarX
MARELHDSLAQSLSYLKIQVTRLQSLIDREGSVASATAVVQELREGLSSAYRQLRELLTTFRIQFDGRGLALALAETIDELRARTATALSLDFQLGRCALDPHEEIHVLQIVREALINVVHHARARHAVVTVRCPDPQGVRVIVRDDGVGMKPRPARVHHYGMIIMHERASTLGGELRVLAPPGGGTEVVLTFLPQSARGAGDAVRPPEPVVMAATPAVPAHLPPAGERLAEEVPGRV